MKFEKGVYTDITGFVFSRNKGHKAAGYIRLFLCPGKYSWVLVRVLPAVNVNNEKNFSKICVQFEQVYIFDLASYSEDPWHDKDCSGVYKPMLSEVIDDDHFSTDIDLIMDDMKALIRALDRGQGVHNIEEWNQLNKGS